MKTLIKLSTVILAFILIGCSTSQFSKRKYTKGRFYHKSNFKSVKGASENKKEKTPREHSEIYFDTISLSIKEYVQKDSELNLVQTKVTSPNEKAKSKNKNTSDKGNVSESIRENHLSPQKQASTKKDKIEVEEVKKKEPRVKNATKKALWALTFSLIGALTGVFFPPLLFIFIGLALYFVYKSVMAKDRNAFSTILVILTVSLCTLLVFFGVFYTKLWLLTITGNVPFF